MDFNATIDLIIKDLDDARNIIDDLKKYPGVPILQVELAKAKCKSAGEVISLLKSLSEQIPEITEIAVEIKKQKLPETDEEKHTPVSSAKIIPRADDIEKNPPVVESTPPRVATKEEPEKVPEKVPESPRIADKFSHLSNRFNEQLGSKKGEDDISDTVNTKPLTSLTEAIGVNDRFLFIREIFDGDKEEYNQAIIRLDNAENLKDARAIIMSYTGDSEENKAVKQLLSLVKRKLPPK